MSTLACGSAGKTRLTGLPRRQGYTVFELVLVLAILVILAGMVYPNLDAMYSGYRLQAGADSVRAAWASARARAMDEGRAYRFSIVPGGANFRVAPDSSEFWAAGDVGMAEGDDSSPPLIIEEALPKAVRFSESTQATDDLGNTSDAEAPASVATSEYQQRAIFLPDGTAQADVSLTMLTRGARPLIVRMRALTGVVSQQTVDEGR